MRYASEPYFNYQWGLENLCQLNENDYDITSNCTNKGTDIHFREAYNLVSKSKRSVIVAIIDSGVDYEHEDLKDNVWRNQDEIVGDNIDNDNNGYVDDVYGWNFCDCSPNILSVQNRAYLNHGTHCAGIICASINQTGIAGIAGDCDIKYMNLKVLDNENATGQVENVVKAIQYAEKMGANICNMSFSTTEKSEKLEEVIRNSKMLFVVAAGNGAKWGSNIDSKPVYPASYSYSNLISVANLRWNGTLHKQSNYGSKSVDIAAPGTDIYSTISNNEYAYSTGTSMATPFVSGVTALIYSQNDTCTASEVKSWICLSSTKSVKLEGKVSSGVLNAYNAMKWAIDD